MLKTFSPEKKEEKKAPTFKAFVRGQDSQERERSFLGMSWQVLLIHVTELTSKLLTNSVLRTPYSVSDPSMVLGLVLVDRQFVD